MTKNLANTITVVNTLPGTPIVLPDGTTIGPDETATVNADIAAALIDAGHLHPVTTPPPATSSKE